jgi:hypothetical protein
VDHGSSNAHWFALDSMWVALTTQTMLEDLEKQQQINFQYYKMQRTPMF